MDSCLLLPLIYALGTGLLTGLIGWFLGKKDATNYADQLKNKEYELSNLRSSMDATLSKTNDSLAVANREKGEAEESLALWKEKFSKLQMQIASDKTQSTEKANSAVPKSSGVEEKSTASNVAIQALKDENKQLKAKTKALEAKLKKETTTSRAKSAQAKKTITADLSKKVHDQYKSEIKKLKTKLKKTKDKLIVTEKALKAKPKEIEITRSIDIESLKKMLDRAPLKKVSERVISRKRKKS